MSINDEYLRLQERFLDRWRQTHVRPEVSDYRELCFPFLKFAANPAIRADDDEGQQMKLKREEKTVVQTTSLLLAVDLGRVDLVRACLLQFLEMQQREQIDLSSFLDFVGAPFGLTSLMLAVLRCADDEGNNAAERSTSNAVSSFHNSLYLIELLLALGANTKIYSQKGRIAFRHRHASGGSQLLQPDGDEPNLDLEAGGHTVWVFVHRLTFEKRNVILEILRSHQEVEEEEIITTTSQSDHYHHHTTQPNSKEISKYSGLTKICAKGFLEMVKVELNILRQSQGEECCQEGDVPVPLFDLDSHRSHKESKIASSKQQPSEVEQQEGKEDETTVRSKKEEVPRTSPSLLQRYLNEVDGHGRTPLQTAVYFNHTEIVKLFVLDFGDEIEELVATVKDAMMTTTLPNMMDKKPCAESTEHQEKEEATSTNEKTKRRKSSNANGNVSFPSLMMACEMKHIHVVQLLLKAVVNASSAASIHKEVSTTTDKEASMSNENNRHQQTNLEKNKKKKDFTSRQEGRREEEVTSPVPPPSPILQAIWEKLLLPPLLRACREPSSSEVVRELLKPVPNIFNSKLMSGGSSSSAGGGSSKVENVQSNNSHCKNQESNTDSLSSSSAMALSCASGGSTTVAAPLSVAIEANNYVVAELLLEKGADLHQVTLQQRAKVADPSMLELIRRYSVSTPAQQAMALSSSSSSVVLKVQDAVESPLYLKLEDSTQLQQRATPTTQHQSSGLTINTSLPSTDSMSPLIRESTNLDRPD